MGQATLDDDLFGEAADELRDDLVTHIEAGEAALPDPDDIWEVDAENVLGVLNTLRSNVTVEEAAEHLRSAKKWYALGERADAFEDGHELEDRLAQLEETIETLTAMRSDVGAVASTLPGVREHLEAIVETDRTPLAAD